MILTELTRIDAVFSRAACMVLLCAGKWIFRYLRQFQENSRKIHAPEASTSQKWGQRGARGAPGALLAWPPPWSRREAAWGAPTSSSALPAPPIYSRDAKTPKNKSFSQF